MWRIDFKQDEKYIRIASWITNDRDEFDVRLSMFRGPNRIIWYCKEPDQQVLTKTSLSDRFNFILMDQGQVLWDIECVITYVGWNPQRECMEIRLEPALYYYLNTVQEFYYKDVTTINNFIKSCIDIENFDYSVSEDLKDEVIFTNCSLKAKPYDVICDLAENYGYEVYCSGKSIAIGRIKPDGISEKDIEQINTFNISTGVYNSHGESFVSLTTDYGLFLPGGYIKWNGKIKKIVYTRFYMGPFHDPKVKVVLNQQQDLAPSMNVIAIDKDSLLDEEMLYAALPEEDRHYLRHVRKYNFDAFVGVVKEEQDLVKSVYPNIINDNLLDVGVLQGDTLEVVKSSPYAGDKVGLQFPKQDLSTDLIIKHKNKTHASISTNQLWTDEIPERSSLDDYRFTLPEGATEYFSPSNNEWIFATKGKITLGYWENASYDVIPEVADSYVEIGPDGIVIKTGDGNFDLDVVGDFDITSEADINLTSGGSKTIIDGGKVEFKDATFGPATKKAARTDDPTKSTTAEDPAFWTFMNILKGIINGPPIPEVGNGAPSSFQTALKAAFANTPTKIVGKITDGSSKVEIK